MSTSKSEDYKEFITAYKRAQNNAVFFLEHFWNVAYPDKAIRLTDEEKEELFSSHYHLIPLFNENDSIRKYTDKIAELKAKGLKNWEIY